MRLGRGSKAALAGLGVLVVAGATLDVALAKMRAVLVKKPIEGRALLHTFGQTSGGATVTFDGFELGAYQPERMSLEGMEELGTHNYLSRNFVEVAPPGREDEPITFELHCAYYTGMLDQVPHVPERCLVGAGWVNGGSTRVVDVPLTFDETGVAGFAPAVGVDESVYGVIYAARCAEVHTRVNLASGVEGLKMKVTPFIDPSGAVVHAGYFFVSNGRVYASAEDLRLKAISLSDEYAYFMKVQFTSRDVESAEELGRVAGRFLDEAFPSLMRRVPDWIDVKEGRAPAGDGAS